MATTRLSNLIDRLSAPIWRSWVGSLPSSSSSSSEFQEDLEELRRTLRRIQAVLNEAEELEIVKESVKLWLSDLKHVAYDAEDVLDEFDNELLRCQMELDSHAQTGTRKRKRQVSDSSPPPPLFDISFQDKMMKRIKRIRKDFDGIDKDRRALRLRKGDGVQSGEPRIVRETSSIPEEHVFGREKEKEEIIKQLLCGSNGKPESSSSHGRCEAKVSLVPIVGMGGIGKTTLAQSVFNDPRVIERFSFRRWVFVGKHFNVKRIIAGILGQPLEDSSLDALYKGLIEEIRKGPAISKDGNAIPPISGSNRLGVANISLEIAGPIKNHEFLIVLDDAWCENREEWEQLWRPLTRGDRGGKVVVTTRSHRVANVMGPVSFKLLMEGLSNAECWLIFEKCAFVNGNSDNYPILKEIGLEIVKKFKGIPMAAKAVGGFLCHTVEENKWLSVLESDIWTLVNDESNIMPILKLSYQYLSPHLKQCFAYCSIFPKDWKFDETEMVQMWIAQGFIPHHGPRRIEDMGFDCFDDLVQRSFFQGVYGTYVMHDLIHDLAKEISKDECLRIGEGNLNLNSGKIRHVSVFINRSEQQNLFDFEKVRTLNVLGDARNFLIAPRDLFCQLKCIRVLNLRGCNITDLSNSIGELKHLRFLDLSDTKIKCLPDSLGSLYNLQTLKLNDVYLGELPKGMGNLINLRCLEAEVEILSKMEGIGKLINLQELKGFKVIQEGGCNIGVLKDLNQIRGELCMWNLENVKCVEEAQQAMLKDKLHLDQLYLKWNTEKDSLGDAEILNALQPPPNLKSLVIGGNGGVKLPRWMEGQTLSKLVSVRLLRCRKWEHLPPLGQLRFLKSLVIEGMDRVKKIRCESYGYGMDKVFPALERLQIIDMARWGGGGGAEGGQLFPALRELHISHCPELREVNCCLQLFPSLGKVSIRNCPKLSNIRGCDGTEQLASLLLSTVEIENCPSLVSFFPGEVLHHRLTALEKLQIWRCKELTSLGLQGLVSLKELWISDCPKLVPEEDGVPSSPMLLSSLEKVNTSNTRKRLLSWLLQQNLSSLKTLLIQCLPELTSFTNEEMEGFQNLSSLKYLSIYNCPNLQSLPVTLQSLSSLHKLEIVGCHQIQSLPELRSLSSLRTLNIKDCPQIQSFPDLQSLYSLNWLGIQGCPRMHSLPELESLSSLKNLLIIKCSQIQSLPEGILPASLQQLTIQGCPVLEERCKKDEGPDWPKIAHIPTNIR